MGGAWWGVVGWWLVGRDGVRRWVGCDVVMIAFVVLVEALGSKMRIMVVGSFGCLSSARRRRRVGCGAL